MLGPYKFVLLFVLGSYTTLTFETKCIYLHCFKQFKLTSTIAVGCLCHSTVNKKESLKIGIGVVL